MVLSAEHVCRAMQVGLPHILVDHGFSHAVCYSQHCSGFAYNIAGCWSILSLLLY